MTSDSFLGKWEASEITPTAKKEADVVFFYSTVTLLARFLGLSTSQPRRTAIW